MLTGSYDRYVEKNLSRIPQPKVVVVRRHLIQLDQFYQALFLIFCLVKLVLVSSTTFW
jgi:hypothetical protein